MQIREHRGALQPMGAFGALAYAAAFAFGSNFERAEEKHDRNG